MDSNGNKKKKGMSARQKWKKTLKRKLLRQSLARGEIPERNIISNICTIEQKNITNNKCTEKQKNITNKKCTKKQKNITNNARTIKQMDRMDRKEESKTFNRIKLALTKNFKNQKKKILELKHTHPKDFVDYEGLINLQEKIHAYKKEELKRKKVIYEVEMQLQRTVVLNVSYGLLLNQEGHLRNLIAANENKNDAFYKEVFEEKSRILQRTELSRLRRLELEEKAWENDKRDAALRRAEERAKTAELMVLLEGVCGHPPEETLQPEDDDDDGLEDILSSEDESIMKDIKLEPEEYVMKDIKLEPLEYI